MYPTTSKSALRQQIRTLLGQMTDKEIAAQSHAIISQIEQCELFRKAGSVLVFAPMRNEPQVQPLVEKWRRSKKFYLPVVCGSTLKAGCCNDYANLSKLNKYGIPEPEPLDQIPEIDLILVPGLAFDTNRNRLGRGGGYYDRFLQNIHACKIGVCFGFQLLPNVPHTENDVKMNKIICGKNSIPLLFFEK